MMNTPPRPGGESPVLEITEPLVLPLQDGEQLRVYVFAVPDKSKHYLSIRRWFLKDGNWRPSHRGVSVPLGEVEKVSAAINTRVARRRSERIGAKGASHEER